MFLAKSGMPPVGSTRSVVMMVRSASLVTVAVCLIAPVAAHLASWKAWSASTANTSSGLAAYSMVFAIFTRLSWLPVVGRTQGGCVSVAAPRGSRAGRASRRGWRRACCGAWPAGLRAGRARPAVAAGPARVTWPPSRLATPDTPQVGRTTPSATRSPAASARAASDRACASDSARSLACACTAAPARSSSETRPPRRQRPPRRTLATGHRDHAVPRPVASPPAAASKAGVRPSPGGPQPGCQLAQRAARLDNEAGSPCTSPVTTASRGRRRSARRRGG